MEWLLGLFIKWVIGERLFIGLVLAATVGGSAYFALMRMRGLAYLTAAVGLCMVAFLIGLSVSDVACETRIRQIETQMQTLIDEERERQRAANEQLRQTQIENAELSARAATARGETVREVRREVRIDDTCRGLGRASLERLRELARGRRERERDRD